MAIEIRRGGESDNRIMGAIGRSGNGDPLQVNRGGWLSFAIVEESTESLGQFNRERSQPTFVDEPNVDQVD